MHVGGILCDLAKAFVCINYAILLAKLHFYGIWGASENWFRYYLSNKRQKVEVKSPNTAQKFFSGCGTLKHGVPWESDL